MDADQRLMALKKAYADIILNNSKEAAARVMAAERKAQRLEHELYMTKEEAVQTMLRLKKMMDDKISEAKRTSQNQQEKIDELEAQLQEAEDIVSELREELRYVQDKFERVTRNDVQHLDKQESATPEEAFNENRHFTSQSISCPLESQEFSLVASDKENSYLNQRTEYLKCPSQLIQMGNSYGTRPELPSIILRSKKQNFSRNGCTQRIHACERNILDGELSLSRNPNGVGSKRNIEGEKKDISTFKATNDGVDKMFNMEGKEAVHKDGSISCWYEVQGINLIPKKVKTTPRYRQNKSASGKKIPDKLFRKIDGTPGVIHSDPRPKSVKNNAQPNEDPTLIHPNLSSDMTCIVTQPECAKTTEMNGDNDKEDDTEKMISKVEAPVDTLVPILEKGASIESSDIQVSKLNLNKINEPILHSELKTTYATSGAPSLHKDRRAIKYIFQRKRKRGTMSISDGNVSAENNTPKRKKEKKTESAEPEKYSLVAE